MPPFTNARHIYTARELEWCRVADHQGNAGVYEPSFLARCVRSAPGARFA